MFYARDQKNILKKNDFFTIFYEFLVIFENEVQAAVKKAMTRVKNDQETCRECIKRTSKS